MSAASGSCGESNDDCREVLQRVYEFLDGEVDESNRSTIEGHLDGCTNCFEAFDFEAELRLMVRAKLAGEVPCPGHLKAKLLEALACCDPKSEGPSSTHQASPNDIA